MSAAEGTDGSGPTRQKWAQSPMFKLRADAVRHLMAGYPAGQFLEVGAGTGELCEQFLSAGHSGYVYDLGQATRNALRRRFAGRPEVSVIDSLDEVEQESVDYLFAFEVLEHIPDDVSALKSWTRKLKRGGILLASVPAHQRKFGASDERVGHVRRYERKQLESLAKHTGYDDVTVSSYGFPLGNLGRMAGNLLERRVEAKLEPDAEQRSITSGVEQSRYVLAIDRFLNPVTLAPFFAMQRLTFATDLGEGYFLRATRAVAAP